MKSTSPISAKPFPRWTLIAVLAATLLGTGIRWRVLDHPMRYDESYNFLHYASKSPGYVVTHYVPNNHVLHTLLVHYSSRLFGEHPAGLRLPSFLFGVMLIPATAWLGWLISRRASVAVVSALMVCGSSAMIEYSANARGYSLLALMTILILIQSVRILEARGEFRRWIALGVTGALGLWTVPILALPLAGISILLMIHEIRSRRHLPTGAMTMLTVAGAGTLLLYSPILIAAGATAMTDATQTAYDVLGKQVLSSSGMIDGAWRLWSRSAGLAWQILLILGLTVATVSMKHTNSRISILAAAVGGAFLLAAIAQAPMPSRTWLFALPPVIVLSVAGLSEWASRSTARSLTKATATAAMLFLAVMPMTRTPFETRLCSEPGGLVEIEPAIEECQSFGSDRCAIVSPYNPAKAYYLRQRGIDALPAPDAPGVERVILVTTPAANLAQLWSADAMGFDRFAPPHAARIAPYGAVYFADRLDRAAAR